MISDRSLYERPPQPGRPCCCGHPAVREVKTTHGWMPTCVMPAEGVRKLAREMALVFKEDSEIPSDLGDSGAW